MQQAMRLHSTSEKLKFQVYTQPMCLPRFGGSCPNLYTTASVTWNTAVFPNGDSLNAPTPDARKPRRKLTS